MSGQLETSRLDTDGRPVAAIDCGTNSTRLLVCDADGRTLDRLMEITRLGQGVDGERALAPEAIQRTLDVLADYRRVLDRHGVGKVRMTATSAARDAANRERFFGPAAQVIGVRPQLLDGDEEGRLSFAGATAELDPAAGPYLIADIGGGSTELAVGPSGDPGADPLRPTAVRSLDIGCVRLTDRFLHHDPPRPDEFAGARAYVHELLQGADRDIPAFGQAATLVGLAGTVAAVAAVAQGLTEYDRARVHHHVLSRNVVEAIEAELAAEPAAVRRRRPGIEPARADVIVGGLVVLVALMRQFDFDECLVSESDILDGLCMSLLS